MLASAAVNLTSRRTVRIEILMSEPYRTAQLFTQLIPRVGETIHMDGWPQLEVVDVQYRTRLRMEGDVGKCDFVLADVTVVVRERR